VFRLSSFPEKRVQQAAFRGRAHALPWSLNLDHKAQLRALVGILPENGISSYRDCAVSGDRGFGL
jgi:hypothetical protein